MKSILFSVLLSLLSLSAFAESDSVGIFHRNDKVVILLNEKGESARLQNFLNSLNVEYGFDFVSADKDVRITCGRNIDAATCTFSFFPSPNVIIGYKTLEAAIELKNSELNAAEEFSMYFESYMADKVFIKILDGHMYVSATKKILK